MRASIRLLSIALAALVAACQQKGPTPDEVEAAKNTIDCDHAGERVIIRFAEGEARLLMSDGTRVILYQVQMPAGLRYTNGLMDMRGRGLDFTLQIDRQTVKMICKPYEIPKKE